MYEEVRERDDDTVSRSFTLDPLRILFRRQTQGPGLIIFGCAALYMMATQIQGDLSPLAYGLSILLGFIVLSGVMLTFRELRRGEVSAESVSLPSSATEFEHAVTQLSKNYELLRRQCTQGFILAAAFMVLGIIVILSGSVGALFGLSQGGSDLASVAGIIMEFISATALLIYRVNFKRLNKTSDELNNTWKILTAHRLAEKLPEGEREKATMRLIEALLAK